MERLVVVNTHTGVILAQRVELARTFLTRLQGLIGRSGLGEGEGLVLEGCNSVHMFFMRFPIDVIFVDRRDKVVGLAWNLQPGAVSRVFPKAFRAVELPAGTIGRTGTGEGDVLEFRPV